MYKQIVVGTDGSAGAHAAVDTAVELARLTGARLHVVHAHSVMTAYHVATAGQVGIVPVDMNQTNDEIHADGQRICNQAAERARAAGVDVETHCVPGDAADSLLSVAADADADLVVVGNRGMSGARRFVLGSVPNKVSHHCPSSLLIVDTSSARG